MKGKFSVFGLMLIGSVFISCSARKDLIVLMPDPDGKVGTVEVSTQAGLQVLTKARESTEVAAANAAPTRPILLEEQKIAAVFGAALAARPDPPLRFLLYFESGSSGLTPDSARVIPEILKAIRARRSTDISVVGHTDQSGTKEINDRLSLDRAVRIKTILTENGVAADTIDVDSHGQNNPLIPTAPGQAEPRNRRVEVTIR